MSASLSQNSLSPSSISSTTSVKAAKLVENQLLSELTQAAQSAMVPIPVTDLRFEGTPTTVQLGTTKSQSSSRKRKFETRKDQTQMRDTIQPQNSIVENRKPLQIGSPSTSKMSGKSSVVKKKSYDAPRPALVPAEESMKETAKHRRFQSEEADPNIIFEPTPVAPSKREEEFEDEDESSDDDDAPEAITAAAGFETSRSTTLNAARTARTQSSALRAQRREKDARLKSQAETTKSQKRPMSSIQIMDDLGVASHEDPIGLHVSNGPSSKRGTVKAGLPSFLPEELLALEPVIQSPKLHPMVSTHTAIRRDKKFFDGGKGKERLKDIKRGGRVVRVLPSQETLLPPSSSTTSKSVREKWLLGQRGFLGVASVPRRSSSGGFGRR